MTTPSVHDLADIEAIKMLKHRYWRMCDGRDAQGFRDCFVRPGARIDFGPGIGVFDDIEPVAAVFEASVTAQLEGGWAMVEQHHGFMPEITITGPDEAVGKWALQHRRVNFVDRTDTVSIGVYDDEYRRVDGEWLISYSKCTMKWVTVRPLAEGEVVHQLTAPDAS